MFVKFKFYRIPYAERKLATGRATLLPINNHQRIRLELSAATRRQIQVYRILYAERKLAIGRATLPPVNNRPDNRLALSAATGRQIQVVSLLKASGVAAFAAEFFSGVSVRKTLIDGF